MRTTSVLGLAAALLLAAWTSYAAPVCKPCGPSYCTGTQDHKAALAAKKAAVAKSTPTPPPRLIALYDNIDACEACVRTAPDGFHILLVGKQGDTLDAGWSPEAERDGAQRVATGELKECHVLLVRRSCACCQAPAYDKRPDYRKDIDLNTRMALPCEAS